MGGKVAHKQSNSTGDRQYKYKDPAFHAREETLDSGHDSQCKSLECRNTTDRESNMWDTRKRHEPNRGLHGGTNRLVVLSQKIRANGKALEKTGILGNTYVSFVFFRFSNGNTLNIDDKDLFSGVEWKKQVRLE